MKNRAQTKPGRPTALNEHAIEFLNDVSVGQSASTVETYRNALKRFAECGASLDANGAIEFARWLSERGVSKSTLRTYLAAVSQWFAYLIRKRVIALDSASLEDMRESFHQFRKGHVKKLPKLPPPSDVIALLDSARAQTYDENDADAKRIALEHKRDIAILEALRSSGMRVGELVALKRGDLDHAQRAARVTGKGDKQRVVYFDNAAWNAITSYLRERGDGARAVLSETLPVFAQHGRNAGTHVLHLQTNRVREMMSDLCESAGIEFRLTPHTLRHAFATRLLETSEDLAVVQDALGHSSPATTRIYAEVSPKRIRDAHKKAFH